ncbi:MAG: heme NO-binding domain-containing protein [Rhodomicrobium sp.]
MKGTITVCLIELVENKFGKDKWAAIIEDAGLAAQASSFRMAPYDIPDEQVLKLIASTCKVLRITAQQAADAFGEYWCCTYAPRVYAPFYKRFKSAREMILGMDKVHVDMTATIPNAQPPRFNYVWENPNTLVVEYKSKRNLIDIYAGLVRGVGRYFKEKLTVTKLSPAQVRIVFQ